MSDPSPRLITTSASSWLGASIGSEIGLLIVLPIGFLLSIWLRSHWMFYFTLMGWGVLAGTGGFWIRRHRYRFDFQRKVVELHTLWFFRSTHNQQIDFEQIRSLQVGYGKHGPRLLMLLNGGDLRLVKAGSLRRLEVIRRQLAGIVLPMRSLETSGRMPEMPIGEPLVFVPLMSVEAGREPLDRNVGLSQSPALEDEGAAVAPAVEVVSAIALATNSQMRAGPTPTVFTRSDLPFPAMQKLKVGVIGGSGLGQLLGGHGVQVQRHEIDTPFGRPSDAIIETEWAGIPVFLLARHGPGHLLNPTQVPYRANIYALKLLGCTHVIASGAVGSLREEMKPRDLAIPDQIIDKTTTRAGTFYDTSAVHVEFSEPFCSVLRQVLVEAGGLSPETGTTDHLIHDRGCYVAMEGPAFSTRAESLMHRLWGGDLIGMTAMPEAKLAREAEISYALVALVTDYDCWRQKPPVAPGQSEPNGNKAVDPFVLLKEIISNLESASANAMSLIRRAIQLIATRQDQLMAAPSRNALQLAIWSERSKIPADDIARLHVLWGQYFEAQTVAHMPDSVNQTSNEATAEAII